MEHACDYVICVFCVPHVAQSWSVDDQWLWLNWLDHKWKCPEQPKHQHLSTLGEIIRISLESHFRDFDVLEVKFAFNRMLLILLIYLKRMILTVQDSRLFFFSF